MYVEYFIVYEEDIIEKSNATDCISKKYKRQYTKQKKILCPDSQNRKVHYRTLDISYIKQKVTRNCQTLFMRLVRIDQHVRYK